MLPWEPTRDIMRRTLFNLEFIEQHATERDGPYEVTQLINSFLGAVAHPWETYRPALDSIPLTAMENWPTLPREKDTDEDPQTVGHVLRLLRNGIAHGNIDFLQSGNDDIRPLRIRNMQRNRRTWGIIIKVADLRRLVTEFVALAEHLGDIELTTRKQRA